MPSKYWFRSDRFAIQDGEDECTNPGRFGKSLAEWLGAELATYGYTTEVIPEDWGWCVMCSRGEFLLWVGCGCMLTEEILESTLDNPPDATRIVWHVFYEVEVPFFKPWSLLRRMVGLLDTATPKSQLGAALEAIILSSSGLQHCPEP